MATVLFADVQGFTSLAEQLDFETVSDLIKDIWSRLDAIVEDGGGYIDKHMGDGVMTVWGAPRAAERDAENAVEAALGLQIGLDQYVAASPLEGTKGLRLRIGINTGQVFATYMGIKNEYTVIGDVVNVANRLQQAADGGGILNAADFFFASEQYEQGIDLAVKRGASAEAEAIRLRAQLAFDKTRRTAQ